MIFQKRLRKMSVILIQREESKFFSLSFFLFSLEFISTVSIKSIAELDFGLKQF